jgi:hypothetical protein
MIFGSFHFLASVDAVRPVFMIVMGFFLLLLGWRLAKNSGVWTSRILMAGALLLGFGYGLMLPLYEAGLIERYAPNRVHYHGSVDDAIGWHAVKMVVMNFGWLVFGTGVAMHSSLSACLVPRSAAKNAAARINPNPRPVPAHESIA